MAVRAELEELVEWITELSAKPKPPDPERLTSQDWTNIETNLGDVSTDFQHASLALYIASGRLPTTDEAALDLRQRSSLLAELTRDLEREAESLRLRAHLLSRRAPPRSKRKADMQEPKEKHKKVSESKDELEAVLAELERKNEQLENTRRDLEDAKRVLAPIKEELRATQDELEAVGARMGRGEGADKELMKAGEAVTEAQRTIETAFKKFADFAKLDSVSQAFAEELDVLAEMALSLRQQCDALLRERRAWRPSRRRFLRLRSIWDPTSTG